MTVVVVVGGVRHTASSYRCGQIPSHRIDRISVGIGRFADSDLPAGGVHGLTGDILDFDPIWAVKVEPGDQNGFTTATAAG